jgi:hypothetical protein
VTRLKSTLLLAATAILCAGTASGQAIVLIATGGAAGFRPTLAVGPTEQAEMAIYNNCSWPVEAEIRVTPYAPEDTAHPYNPETITRTLPAKGFSFVPLNLLPTVDTIAYADVAVGPAFDQGPASSCSAPGMAAIQAAIAIRPSGGGAPREVIPVKWSGPSFKSDDTSSDADGVVGPQTMGSLVMPVSRGDKVQIPIENTCADVRGGTFVLTYTGGDGNDVVLSEVDLEPGERKVVSVTPLEPDGTDNADDIWIWISPDPPGTLACPDAIKTAFIYKTGSSRF